MNRRNQIIIIVLIAIIAISAIISSFMISPSNKQDSETTSTISEQTITINLPEGVVADIYSADDDTYREEAELAVQLTIEKTQENIQLNSGTYFLVTRATDTYQKSSQSFTVTDQPITVTANPSYSTSDLNIILNNEQGKIIASLYESYPQAKNLYDVSDGKIYTDGSWYAAKLIYKGSSTSQNDTLRFVAHQQEDGSWKIVTTPPDITVSTISYPEIPEEVAMDINNFQ